MRTGVEAKNNICDVLLRRKKFPTDFYKQISKCTQSKLFHLPKLHPFYQFSSGPSCHVSYLKSHFLITLRVLDFMRRARSFEKEPLQFRTYPEEPQHNLFANSVPLVWNIGMTYIFSTYNQIICRVVRMRGITFCFLGWNFWAFSLGELRFCLRPSLLSLTC